jgi:ATP-dependent Clp protease ATP-binding subunit ClpC
METQTNKPQFIYCPTCEGRGIGKLGMNCPNCGGIGLGKFFGSRIYYWGMRLGWTVIELNKFRKKAQLTINIVAYTICIIGLLCLGVWTFFAGQNSRELEALAFWREKSPLILIFWLSVIVDMFIIYRLNEEERQMHKIASAKYGDSEEDILPQSWEEIKKAKAKSKIDVWGGFSPHALTVIDEAFLLAQKLKHPYVTPLHIFFACLNDPQVAVIFSRLDISAEHLIESIKKQLFKIKITEAKTELSRTAKEVFINAYLQAYQLGQRKVSAKNLIMPCLEKDETIAEILYDLEADKNKIFNVILWLIINEKQVESYRKFKQMARFKPSTNMDRAYTSVATPLLNHHAYDLTIAAKWGKLEYCVARNDEIEKIWQQFESGYNGILLVGPTGVGKGAIIDGIAQLMVQENVPKFLQDKRLVELDAARLISGVTPEQAEGRLVEMVDEVNRAGNIVLFIDNVETICGITSGNEGSLDLSEVLANAIERKEIFCFAAATDKNYSQFLENRSLANVMAKIDIKEPVGNQAIQIIESKIGYLEGKYNVYFSYNAIEHAVKLTSQYIHDKYLPEKAIIVLEQVAAQVSKKRGRQRLVSHEDIARVVSEITGIPVTKISETESKVLLHLEDKIHERMIDQEEAVQMVSASLRRARAGMREGKRPIANFLFLGPTGVGKTELAKAVADIYFGNEKYMIRVDMSEYQHADSIPKMIGDERGAIGYLTEAVRKQPFSLVLLDEFEKAHPQILNLFLQVMDDGRLTDGQGRTIDFTNAIIIATSNAGSLFIQEQIRAGVKIVQIKEALINEHLNTIMKPELVNRFDGVIVFKPLAKEDVIQIARLMLNKTKKMLETKGISLNIAEEGIAKLAELGFDPKFGARPLRRVLQEKIDDSIANKILTGELKRRDTVIIDEEAKVTIAKGKEL